MGSRRLKPPPYTYPPKIHSMADDFVQHTKPLQLAENTLGRVLLAGLRVVLSGRNCSYGVQNRRAGRCRRRVAAAAMQICTWGLFSVAPRARDMGRAINLPRSRSRQSRQPGLMRLLGKSMCLAQRRKGAVEVMYITLTLVHSRAVY